MASSPTPSISKSLMLKDFIRDDRDDPDESGKRRCVGLGAAGSHCGLLRTCRNNPLASKLYSVVNAVRILPFFSSSSPGPRKIFRRPFWKKRVAEARPENHRSSISSSSSTAVGGGRILLIRDIIRSDPFAEETHGRISLSFSSNDWWDFTASEDSVSTSESTSQSAEMANNGTTVGPSGTTVNSDSVESSNNRSQPGHHDHKEDRTETTKCTCRRHRYEDKDQFSPVSVLDSLSEEEEEPAASPSTALWRPSSFHRNLAKFENTWQHLLQQIGRFETLAQVQPGNTEVPVEEEDEEEEERAEVARELLEKTRTEAKCNDKLLLDFFVQEIREENRTEEDLLSTARDWIERSGTALEDDGGVELNIKEIARDVRWRCIHVAEREDIAADVESGVLVSLIDEVLLDLMDF